LVYNISHTKKYIRSLGMNIDSTRIYEILVYDILHTNKYIVFRNEYRFNRNLSNIST